MTAADQLALDEHDAAAVHRQRESGTDERWAASDPPEGERDRWRVSGLFVQPREHNDPEEDRER